MILAPARAEALANQLEADRREQQHDLPVHLQRAQHFPDAARQAGQDERREVPDGLLRAQLPQPAAGEAAADGERQGDDLAVGERRQPDQGADRGAGVRAGDEPGHERALEAQVGGLVIEQQPRDDARRERDAEEQDEDQAIGPVAALENQDVAEPPVPRQHRRQRGHDGQLDDERREQDLLERQELRAGHDLH